MNEPIAKLAEEASQLCEDCGYKDQADWFRSRIPKLQDCQERSQVLGEISGILAGMGSFSDLSLVPPPDYHMTEQALRTRQWDLVEEIGEAIAALQSNEGP